MENESVTLLVDEQLKLAFNVVEAQMARGMFGVAKFPRVKSNSERERIQLAIIYLARGKMDWLLKALEAASSDWRGVLTSAGMAHAEWRTTLIQRGIDEGKLQKPKNS